MRAAALGMDLVSSTPNACRYSSNLHSVSLLGCLWFLAAVALFSCPTAVRADTVDLTNGKKVEGEIIEDIVGNPLVFRYRAGDEWKTRAVERKQILRYRREPGNQADKATVGARQQLDDESDAPDDDESRSLEPLPASGNVNAGDIKRLLRGLLPPPSA